VDSDDNEMLMEDYCVQLLGDLNSGHWLSW